MKLYTEEQIRKAMNDYANTSSDLDNVMDVEMAIIEQLTPIELPSDEEAGVIALNIASTLKDGLDSREEAFYLAGFQTCAKWMKEQILNQKNSNHQEVTSDTPSNYQRGWNAAQRGLLQNDAWGDTYTDNVNNRPSHEELDEWLRGWKAYRYSNEIAKNK